MLQDQSIEAYNIYQKLSKMQKDAVLQEQFEVDNDMGSDGDGNIETTKENLSVLLDDAKNGKKYLKGGFVGKGEMVWKKLKTSQKAEFLYENFTPQITPRSQEILVGKTYKFLPKNVKIVLESKYANVENFSNGGKMAKGGFATTSLKEGDFVWNEVGNKLIVRKVNNDEYLLEGFGGISASPFSKPKVDGYIKSGKWTLKPKMAKGGEIHKTQS
jgi:hypothetical protein